MTINRANQTWPEDVMTIIQMERAIQQELIECPQCGEDVCTVAAEGVPAQQLRGCPCGATFFIDMNSAPRYAEPESEMEFERRQRGSASTLAALFIITLFVVCAVAVWPVLRALANVVK